MTKIYTQEELLDYLDNYPTKPTMRGFDADPSVPSTHYYRKHFGSWSNALKVLNITPGGSSKRKYTNEQLIGYLLDYPVKPTSDIFNIDKSVPCAATYRKYFGSWSNALIAANITPNKGGFDYHKPTIVYCLDFGGFYKYGVTQRTIEQRFSHGYPSYTVLYTKEMSLSAALRVERKYSELFKDSKYIPEHLSFHRETGGGCGGKTECFTYDCPKRLSAILARENV